MIRWPWAGKPVGPPWVFTDATVAAIRDPAARNLLDQLAGQVRDLRGQVAAIANLQREQIERLAEVQYRKGSRFAELDRAAARLRQRASAPEG